MLYETAHVRVEADAPAATLRLDFPGDPPNLLPLPRLAEVVRAAEVAAANPAVEVLLVRSAKPAGFSAGGGFATDAGSAADGQRLLAALAAVPVPTVAVLHGPVLGAGLELALACDYRLAVAAPDTYLGFPEAADGVFPAWGGATRLARLAGRRAALDLLRSGRLVSAREAKALGLVDHAYCDRRAKIELRTFLDRLTGRPGKPRRRRWDWLSLSRPAGADPAGRVVPAAVRSTAEGFAAERKEARPSPGGVFGELARRPPAVRARNPVGPFPGVVGLVGGGEWPAILAAETAARGGRVVGLPQPDAVATVLAGRLTPLEVERAVGRVSPPDLVAPWAGYTQAGLVIVADPAARFPEVEDHVSPRAVIAVADASVAAAQELADRPGRVAGVAFPVHPGPGGVAEVVAGPETDADTLAALAAWLRVLGMMPVVVSDRPGQVVRRILEAAWDEAARLVAEGVPADLVDRAAVDAGFAVGPLIDLDAVGFAAARERVPRLVPLAAAGLTGRPGDGFYTHALYDPPEPNVVAQIVLWDALCLTNARRGKAVLPDPDAAAAAAADRLRLRAVNAAAAALADEAHAGPAEVDLLAAWGAGILRPAGGPLRWADAAGVRSVAARLGELAGRWGKRFRPHPELARRAAAGEGFHAEREPRRVAA